MYQIPSFFFSVRCRSPVSISSHYKQEQEVGIVAYFFVLAKVQEGVNERQLWFSVGRLEVENGTCHPGGQDGIAWEFPRLLAGDQGLGWHFWREKRENEEMGAVEIAATIRLRSCQSCAPFLLVLFSTWLLSLNHFWNSVTTILGSDSFGCHIFPDLLRKARIRVKTSRCASNISRSRGRSFASGSSCLQQTRPWSHPPRRHHHSTCRTSLLVQ